MKEVQLPMNRRNFLGAGSAVAAGSLIQPGSGMAQGKKKLKVALCGTGSRGTGMWGADIVKDYPEDVEFVALFDINPTRMEYAKNYMGVSCPMYTDFDKMVRETKPETIIVTTKDSTHEQYIIRGMELGCDIITEKPMAVDEKQCQRILDTEKRTGQKITVTFNYRYGPDATTAKEILNSGEIGEVTSVDWHWWLDVYHGSDYFRRWHAYRENGGSLWVHKATHHFDLMNWWLDADPVEVFAKGELRTYGKNGKFRGKNCRSCQHQQKCPFYWDVTTRQRYVDLYVTPEKDDGYFRDGCVFREDIDIWDTMVATISYSNDVIMSYSLNAFMPYEGATVGFNGTKGRLDLTIFHRQPWEEERLAEIRVTQNFKQTYTRDIYHGGGGHGGADKPMKDSIFLGAENYLNRSAGSRAGAYSIISGIAAYHSIDEKRPIKITDLVKI
jgi:predicted dehydrogenase